MVRDQRSLWLWSGTAMSSIPALSFFTLSLTCMKEVPGALVTAHRDVSYHTLVTRSRVTAPGGPKQSHGSALNRQ